MVKDGAGLQTQHSQTPQRPALPSTGTRKHDADRPKIDYALTSNMDHQMGALQVRT